MLIPSIKHYLRRTSLSKKHLSLLTRNFASQEAQDTNFPPNDPESFDIIINGGGIVGFSLLSSLKNSPFLRDKRILLLEQQPLRQKKNHDDSVQGERKLSNRVSSLTTSSVGFLKQIGAWNQLKDYAKPIKSMYVWAQNFRNGITFWPTDEEAVCYVVENNRVTAALMETIAEEEHAVCYGTGVVDVKTANNKVCVDSFCSNNEYTNNMLTSFLVGCDGFTSLIREKSDLKTFEHDFDQCGIVGTVAVSSDQFNENNEIAYQRFVPSDNSVVALLPLTKEMSSFVWSTSKTKAAELIQMNDEQFVDALNEALFSESSFQQSSLIGACDKILDSLLSARFLSKPPPTSAPHVLLVESGSRASFPLKFSTTLPFMVGSPMGTNLNRVVIIGDAAHRIHPLAGQGLNLGIGDVQVLVRHLHEAFARGENLFGENGYRQLRQCLMDFERERQLKLIPMMAAIHSMQQLFNLVPSRCLSAFNQFDFVKQQLVKFANSN